MAWTVRNKRTLLSVEGDFVFKIFAGLLAAGASVYGSSDAVSFTNAGAGATNYWTTRAIATSTNAWIRLRFPAVGGVTRELMIQRSATARRWHIYWSSDGTGFTGGAPSASARPTAADEQFVQNATTDFEPQLMDVSNQRASMYFVTGDASEGYSFFATLVRDETQAAVKILFLDVLQDGPSSDADPAIYGASAEGTAFGADASTHSLIVDTTVTNNDTNIGGWFKKGTGSAAWVAYPIQTGYGWTSGTEVIQRITAQNRLPDLRQGAVSSWRCRYFRSVNQSFTTQLGFKGKSRLFRVVNQYAGRFRVDALRKQMTFGEVVIPWDGSSME